MLGRVGNSGRSLFRHLHLQLMDGTDFATAKALPFKVESFQRRAGQGWKSGHREPLAKARTCRFGIGS